MTMTPSRPAAAQPRTASRIAWRLVQPGLWVGSANGEFAGMIEARPGEGFSATSRLAKSVGTFATVDAAKASFTD